MEIHGYRPAARLPLPESMLRFSAVGEPGMRRVSRLRSALASEEQGHPFSGRMLITDLGGIRLCRIAAHPHAEGQPHPQPPFRDTPFYKLVFQVSGTTHLDQDGRRVVLRAGDWSLYDGSRPYAMCHLTEIEQLAILLPKSGRHQAVAQFARLLPDFAFSTSGMAGVLMNALASTLAESDMIDVQVEEELAETLYDLSRFALSERVHARERAPVADTLRCRIEAFVLKNLRDQDLSVETIAQRMKCSKRYLHKVFRSSEQTLNEFIWSTRLMRCERDLLDPGLAHRSITEIAFSWGFVNSAHFSRSFKARYGAAPRDYRQMRVRLF